MKSYSLPLLSYSFSCKSVKFRANTVPCKNIDININFKKTKIFFYIENLFYISSNFTLIEYNKFDMDTFLAKYNFNNFFYNLEQIQCLLKIQLKKRNYRDRFSKAFKTLFKRNEIFYLIEILESAQEGISYIYINDDKYTFEENILKNGHLLYISFLKFLEVLNDIVFNLNNEFSINEEKNIKNKLIKLIEDFDKKWVIYERSYIFKLMEIEIKAKNYWKHSISLEKKLSIEESKQKIKGKIIIKSKNYNELREKLVKQFNILNSRGNIEGHGRDDLVIDILNEAENTLHKISPSQSLSIIKLCKNIKLKFLEFRNLMKEYNKRLDMIDPHLCNNKDLTDLLLQYEKYWERGKEYLLDKYKFNQLLYFSNLIEGLIEKHSKFKDIIEYIDSNLFIIIPMIIIFKSLENEDKGIVENFLPPINSNNTKIHNIYTNLKEDIFKLNSNIFKNNFNKTKLSKSFNFNKSLIYKKKNSIFKKKNFIIKKNYKTILISQKKYKCKKLNNSLYNLIEKLIIEIDLNKKEKTIYDYNKTIIIKIIKDLKYLSIELERYNPHNWNKFIDVVLDN